MDGSFNPAPLAVPHARERAPWFECGQYDPDGFGNVYVRPGACGSMVAYFDRAERLHACTYSASHLPLGPEVVLHGRRFTVVYTDERPSTYSNGRA